ncbi:unnamed protein product [Sphagnum tenellum]
MESSQMPMKVINIQDKKVLESHNSSNCSQIKELHTLPQQKQSVLMVVWVENSNVAKVLQLFANTVQKCPTQILTGVYYADNGFLFLANEADDVIKVKRAVFSDPFIMRHRHVALAAKSGISSSSFVVYNYDAYSRQVKASFIWKEGVGFSSLEELYPDFRWTGYEIDILAAASSSLGFAYDIVNPEDEEWGQVDENGTWDRHDRLRRQRGLRLRHQRYQPVGAKAQGS